MSGKKSPAEDKDQGLGSGKYKAMAMLSSMGVAMLLTSLLGIGVGYYLDKKFGTEPWLMLIFLILGIAAGFKNMFTILKRYGFNDPE